LRSASSCCSNSCSAAASSGRHAPTRLTTIFQRSRSEQATADQELAKVVEVIADLFVSPPNSAYANTLSRDELHGCVSNFMRQAGITGLRTNTQMLHVVMSPVQITAPGAVEADRAGRRRLRDFIRIADDKWTFRTRKADDMERAIRGGRRGVGPRRRHDEAARLQLQKPAPAPPPAPSRPQSPAPAARKTRPTDPARQNCRRLELCSVAAKPDEPPLGSDLSNWKFSSPWPKVPIRNVKVVDLGSDDSTPGADILKTIARQISQGQVSAG